MNNVEKIKQEAQTLRDQLNNRANIDEFVQGELYILNYFLAYIAIMQEEPVNEDYAEEVLSWEDSHDEWDRLIIRQTAKHFTDWQKQKMTDAVLDGIVIQESKMLSCPGSSVWIKCIAENMHIDDKVKLTIIKEG